MRLHALVCTHCWRGALRVARLPRRVQGRYVGGKKNGEGVYEFINHDTYEGEFRDDRMDGYGVYTFRCVMIA